MHTRPTHIPTATERTRHPPPQTKGYSVVTRESRARVLALAFGRVHRRYVPSKYDALLCGMFHIFLRLSRTVRSRGQRGALWVLQGNFLFRFPHRDFLTGGVGLMCVCVSVCYTLRSAQRGNVSCKQATRKNMANFRKS